MQVQTQKSMETMRGTSIALDVIKQPGFLGMRIPPVFSQMFLVDPVVDHLLIYLNISHYQRCVLLFGLVAPIKGRNWWFCGAPLAGSLKLKVRSEDSEQWEWVFPGRLEFSRPSGIVWTKHQLNGEVNRPSWKGRKPGPQWWLRLQEVRSAVDCLWLLVGVTRTKVKGNEAQLPVGDLKVIVNDVSW